MHTISCIKCGDNYQSEDPDPYYCKSCNDARLALAEEVDAKIRARGTKRKTVSALAEYDASPKVHGFVQARL